MKKKHMQETETPELSLMDSPHYWNTISTENWPNTYVSSLLVEWLYSLLSVTHIILEHAPPIFSTS